MTKPNYREIEMLNGTRILISYATRVAAHVPDHGFICTSTKYSQTTSRHVNQWLQRNGNPPHRNVDQQIIDQL